MKILHTSDWHLGHRLHEMSQHEEQLLFLKWLERYIIDNSIDILLISGDIFDTGVPSTQSQKLYYDFLIAISATPCSHIVITGGNHDAPGTLNAPKLLLDALSIKVVGRAEDNISDEIFRLRVDKKESSSEVNNLFNLDYEEIIIAAVPYLRDQDIRRAVAGESFEQIGDRYKKALIYHYSEAAKASEMVADSSTPVVAMGHLFAIGGSTSDSEQSIYVGNLGDIGVNDFPDLFDYTALGHLHRPQKVGGRDNIRYSGSPIILSFSEINYDKKIIEIETSGKSIESITDITVPKFRSICRIKGDIEESIAKIRELTELQHSLTPWVEVILEGGDSSKSAISKIKEECDNLDIEILRIVAESVEFSAIDKLSKERINLSELTPLEVFKMRCSEQNFNIDESPDVVDAFHEALQIAQEG